MDALKPDEIVSAVANARTPWTAVAAAIVCVILAGLYLWKMGKNDRIVMTANHRSNNYILLNPNAAEALLGIILKNKEEQSDSSPNKECDQKLPRAPGSDGEDGRDRRNAQVLRTKEREKGLVTMFRRHSSPALTLMEQKKAWLFQFAKAGGKRGM